MGEHGGTLRVLLVDDDPGVIALLNDSLQLIGGYEVTVARDGAVGLACVYEARPDCIIVDVRMPGLNGYQFVRALRGDPATADKPVIILSALAQDRDELAGMLSGADAYLFKPVKMADLFHALEHVLKLSDAERLNRIRLLAEDQSLP